MASPGDTLVDRYELQSRLGRGGMAEVFRAHDRRLSREVAVKVLADDLLADDRSVARFDREARSAASLNHPNIVNVYDAISDGDTHAIVMELVEGPTLADIVEHDAPMPPADAVRIAISIADALQAAHDRGLVHHDVKPRNVLFDGDGGLKVTDFGIARAASSDITTVQGSPPYLAPEQARGGQSDRRSDIYALGCVLFEMLAGRPPFEGDSSSSVIMAHIDAPIPQLSSVRPGVPKELEAIVTRALAKDPEQRFDSPAAMRAELTRIAGNLPSDATIVSSTRSMPQDATMALDDEWDDAPPPLPYDEQPERRRGVSARAVAITLAAVLLLAVLAMAWADNRGRETAQADPVVTEEPAEPDQNAADEDAAGEGDGSGSNDAEVDRLNQLTDRLQGLLERGRDADQATQDRIDELQRELEDALSQIGQGADESGSGSGSDSGSGDAPASENNQLQQLRDRLDQLAEDQNLSDRVTDRLRDIVDRFNPGG